MRQGMYVWLICLVLAAPLAAQVAGPRAGASPASADSARYAALLEKANGFYSASLPDSAIRYAGQLAALAGQKPMPYYLARAHIVLANSYLAIGDYPWPWKTTCNRWHILPKWVTAWAWPTNTITWGACTSARASMTRRWPISKSPTR